MCLDCPYFYRGTCLGLHLFASASYAITHLALTIIPLPVPLPPPHPTRHLDLAPSPDNKPHHGTLARPPPRPRGTPPGAQTLP